MKNKHALCERFLKYVRINTQSDPDSKNYPSSKNQKVLGQLLVEELSALGIPASIDQYGYVLATIASNSTKNIPALCFCSHLDTSPDCTAENVNPIIHKSYDGRDIQLPADERQVIKTSDFPELREKIGMDIITADGTTLLGADNKAGVTELMEAAHRLVSEPTIKHGIIKLLFTPDEEIGKDTEYLDLEKLDVSYAYSVDGHVLASINDQTFFTGVAKVGITGATIHTGKGGGIMESALRIANKLIEKIPERYSPEIANGSDGFIHASHLTGKIDHAEIKFQIRAFEEKELLRLSDLLQDDLKTIMKSFPRSHFLYEFKVNDRNIKEIVDKYPFLIKIAEEAVRRSGLNPVVKPLRGSTTGASLAHSGIPCPNIFTGQHGVHGKLEWICLQDMEKAVKTVLNVCQIWEEKIEQFLR